MKPYENLSLDDMPGELWKEVPNYGGRYLASSRGRVCCVEHTTNGIHYKACIVRQAKNKRGYCIVHLNTKTFLTSRIIAATFCENPQKKPCVDHINGDKLDNRPQNLRWVTHHENANNHITRRKALMRIAEVGQPSGKFSRKARPVVGINIETNEVRKYEFIKQTAQDGFTPSNVSGACRKVWKSSRGWLWFYKDDPNLKSYLPTECQYPSQDS